MHVFKHKHMKNKLFIACCLAVLPLIGTRAQAIKDIDPLPRVLSWDAALPEKLQAQLEKFKKTLTKKSSRQPVISSAIVEEVQGGQYHWVLPTFTIRNTSHGHELLEVGLGKFNAKRDRLSSAMIDTNNRIQILNQRRQICDPALFEFAMEPNGMHMEGNMIIMDAFLPEVVAGAVPLEQKITVKHKESGLTYTYNVNLSFPDSAAWHSLSKEMVFMAYPAAADTNVVLAYNRTDKQVMFVQLPFNIYGNGLDGADGRDGTKGRNGSNSYTYKDKNGVMHTKSGTCGTAGGNGTDGEDGGNGGSYLIILDENLVASKGIAEVITWVDGGKGGQGGKGGKGGTHGSGSGCSGKAEDGANGKNGKNGKNGDYLYVVTNTTNLKNIFIPL